MNNPTLSREQATVLARSRGCTHPVMLLGLRSPTSRYGEYDDTLALLTPDTYIEWKGNTMPSKWGPGIGMLMPGDWEWEMGLHGIHHFADIEKALGNAKRDEVEAYLWANLNQFKDYPEELKDAQGNALIIPYPAFRQAGPMSIKRFGKPLLELFEDPNQWPYCDGHRGGWNGTSSLMCQTWFPDHWEEARRLTYTAMQAHLQRRITYGLHQLVGK